MITSEVRTRIRMQLDVETDELPDAHLDWFLDDAYNATIGIETMWPFFEATSTITLVAGTGAYALPANWRELRSARIVDPDVRLQEIGHDDAEWMWSHPTDSTGTPVYWSRWGSQIHIWPAPSFGTTLHVRGYRKPTDWLAGASNEMDCDERLQPAVLLYALSRAYEQQEDEVLSEVYMNRWAAKVKSARDDILRPSSHQPRVLNRGISRAQPWNRYRFVP